MTEYLPLWDRGNSADFVLTQEVFDKFFEGRDVSLATKHSILVLIRITIRMRRYFNGIFAVGNTANRENSAGSAAYSRFALTECYCCADIMAKINVNISVSGNFLTIFRFSHYSE